MFSHVNKKFTSFSPKDFHNGSVDQSRMRQNQPQHPQQGWNRPAPWIQQTQVNQQAAWETPNMRRWNHQENYNMNFPPMNVGNNGQRFW